MKILGKIVIGVLFFIGVVFIAAIFVAGCSNQPPCVQWDTTPPKVDAKIYRQCINTLEGYRDTRYTSVDRMHEYCVEAATRSKRVCVKRKQVTVTAAWRSDISLGS